MKVLLAAKEDLIIFPMNSNERVFHFSNVPK